MEITKKIKILLLEQDKTCLKMARDLNISPSSLSMYIGGWRTPSKERQEKIAEYLGVSVTSIFYRE